MLAVIYGSYALDMRLGGSAAVRLPQQGNVSAILNRLAPQGWAFFTKPTLSAAPVAVEIEDGHPVKVAGFSNAQLRFIGGLNRQGRRQGVEMATILQGIPKRSWRQCAGKPARACLKSVEPIRVSNPLPHPTLCGRVLIVGVRPTPWQWRDLVKNPTYDAEAIPLRVDCRP